MRQLPDPNLPWPIPMRAVGMICDYESLRLRAYLCPAAVWTCGWGETQGVTPTTAWTKQEADGRLLSSLVARVEQVLELCTNYPTPNQLGAMVSLAYNIGMGNFKKSSVLRLHNAGQSQAASRAFNLFNKARVRGALVELAGLTARRASEQALYLTPEPEDSPLPMPQVVVPESKLVVSPMAQTGTALSLTGALGVAGEFTDKTSGIFGQIKTFAETLGIQPSYILWGAIAVGGVVIIYHRFLQRREGWV